MHVLDFTVQVAGTPASIRANVQAALARNLPELAASPIVHDGTMVCVGSGPSLTDQVEAIRAERRAGRPIFSVKGSHDFLCQHELAPDLWICVDPRDSSHLVKAANDFTTYVLSSRCDAPIFDALATRRVLLCHTWGEAEDCPEYRGKLLLGGGSTSGLRAITVAYVLGFRKIILYGYDSCLASDKRTKYFSGENIGDGAVVDVIVNGQRFWANGGMAKQAMDFQELYKIMPDLHVEVVGGGLIAAILEARKERGFAA